MVAHKDYGKKVNIKSSMENLNEILEVLNEGLCIYETKKLMKN